MDRRNKIVVAALIASTLPLTAIAATVGSSFDVTITLENACDVTTTAPTDMDFGTQSLLTSAKTATSTITVTCTSGATYDIGLDAGANESSADDTTTRRMINGGTNYVSYDLLQPDGVTHWGNTVSTDTYADTGTGSPQAFTVNGTVPIQSTPPAGAYSDTVQVTVTY
jgi:spore coat protein U-like protein